MFIYLLPSLPKTRFFYGLMMDRCECAKLLCLTDVCRQSMYLPNLVLNALPVANVRKPSRNEKGELLVRMKKRVQIYGTVPITKIRYRIRKLCEHDIIEIGGKVDVSTAVNDCLLRENTKIPFYVMSSTAIYPMNKTPRNLRVSKYIDFRHFIMFLT
ncbi:MAG: hypothetical protein DRJ38_08170 [Thermoprotei archaeon]|nr:MAG: hypothetical protein DRJ38_08170 [Thermoprotei archaeon]